MKKKKKKEEEEEEEEEEAREQGCRLGKERATGLKGEEKKWTRFSFALESGDEKSRVFDLVLQ